MVSKPHSLGGVTAAPTSQVTSYPAQFWQPALHQQTEE